MLTENNWYIRSLGDIYAALHSGGGGLSSEEVLKRLESYGTNALREEKPDGMLVIFARQFQSPLIYVLLAASVILFSIGDNSEGIIIRFVLFFNAIVGTIQEGKARNTLRALRNLVETKTVVLRDGQETIAVDKEIVPGDMLILEEGDKISADARVVLSHNLKVDEAALSGESTPVHKIEEIITATNPPVQEQKNMVFKGTNIVAGNGKAIVVATGNNSEIGKIATKISTIDADLPLKENIKNLSKTIVLGVGIIGATLFVWGISTGKTAAEMFATVVSLAVSLIPEGLPIVMTLVLATGVWRMSKRNALVKHLQAVEALGQAQIIAVDKTGTITKNEMVIKKVYADGKIYSVEGVGYEPSGGIDFAGKPIDPKDQSTLLLAGKIAALSANARAIFNEKTVVWKIIGDPTEAPLHV